MGFETQYPADECAGCREYEQERATLTARLAEAEARNECPQCGLTPGPTAQRWCAECVGELQQQLQAAKGGRDGIS